MNHIMIDLETLDTVPSSIILSIGAVYFDSGGLGREFYLPIKLEGQEKRTWSVDTLLWWMNQSEDARKATFLNNEAVLLHDALIKLANFIFSFNNDHVLIWSNGPDFDAAILQDAYKKELINVPWSYSQNRCYRTYRDFHTPIDIARLGAHNALSDAKYQALHMVQWLKVEEDV